LVKRKVGSFKEFQAFTLAVARGARAPEPGAPKIWYERASGGKRVRSPTRFRSLEAGAKLLSAKNRLLLRIVAQRKPRSVTELARLTGRAEQNVLRTLRKFVAAGIVTLAKGEGRALRPVLTARKVHFEIDLYAA